MDFLTARGQCSLVRNGDGTPAWRVKQGESSARIRAPVCGAFVVARCGVKQGLTFVLPAAMALQPLTYVLGLWLHDNWMAERINNGMFNSWQGSGPSPRRAGNSTVDRIVWEPELPMSARKALIESLERGPLPPLA